MKTSRIILALMITLLTGAAAMGFAGCGDKSGGGKSNSTGTGTSTGTSTGTNTGTGTVMGTGYIVVNLSSGEETEHETLPDLLTNDAYKTTHMVLKHIPAGSFQMGDEVGEGSSHELPVHTVNITQGFYMGVFEVTQRQWYEIIGDWPSYFTSNPDNRPVEMVSWYDIENTGGFMNTLSTLTSKTYRLPTEAEWEYCCKAGTSTSFSYGNSADGAYMWYEVNSDEGDGNETKEVGTNLPNPWGLYDMHGNVWEWCQDWYNSDYYSISPANDPQGPASDSYRVLRGGDFDKSAFICRTSYRGYGMPEFGTVYIGFRVCRSGP